MNWQPFDPKQDTLPPGRHIICCVVHGRTIVAPTIGGHSLPTVKKKSQPVSTDHIIRHNMERHKHCPLLVIAAIPRCLGNWRAVFLCTDYVITIKKREQRKKVGYLNK